MKAALIVKPKGEVKNTVEKVIQILEAKGITPLLEKETVERLVINKQLALKGVKKNNYDRADKNGRYQCQQYILPYTIRFSHQFSTSLFLVSIS